MKIGEYEQMMAYLKDSFNPSELRARVAMLESNNAIGGGIIQGQDLGTREGFAGPKLLKAGENAGKYQVKYRDPELGKRADGRGNIEATKYFNTKKEADAFYKENLKNLGKKKAEGKAVKMTEHAETINNAVSKFFDENINKYDIDEFEKFKKDLVKKIKNIPDIPGRKTISKEYPNVGNVESRLPFSKYIIYVLAEASGSAKIDVKDTFFKKLFYAGKLETDPDLANSAKSYFNYVSLNKTGRNLDSLKQNYSAFFDNPNDVLYLLSDETGLKGKAMSNVLRTYFPESYPQFSEKMNLSTKARRENIATIENFLTNKQLKDALDGETSIEKFMSKQHDALKKIFNPKGLDRNLFMATDHVEGIAEIARMDNADDMVRGLKNLIGMTNIRNLKLGMNGFSNKRKSLINKINDGIDVEANLKELNKITSMGDPVAGIEPAYPELKGKPAYQIKNGNLTVTNNFNFSKNKQSDRFIQYFSELTDDKKAKKMIFQQLPKNVQLQNIMKEVAMSKKDKGALAKQLDKAGVKLTKSQKTRMNELGYIDADLLKDIGRTAGSGVLKTLAALDIPILQLGFASMADFAEDNPLMTTIPLMFTDEASKLTGLYNQSGGKFKKFMRLAARAGVPLEKAKTIFPMISKVGRVGSLATPVLETVQEGYKAARNVSRAKEEARNFGIPEEQAMEGLEKMYALNRPVVGDYMDAPEMSERGKANIESLKRGFQQLGSFFGLSEDPYAMREQKAEGDKPKGAAKMTRRTFLKLASLVPAVLTGAAAIRFGPTKTKKIFTAIENLKDTTTKLPTWFKGFADKFRNTGDSVNIYKKQKVPISKGEYERAELAKEANVYSDTARTLDYKKNNPHHMDYYRLVDTDELVGTTYTNKDMPGIQIDDFADGELSVKFENDYSQESELVYVKPGSKYSDYQIRDKRYMYEQSNTEETAKTKGDFIAYDSQPRSTTPDGDYDIDAVVVDDVGNMLEGTTRSMEEYYTGKPVDEISAGEKQIMRAEMKAEETPDDD